MALYGSDTEPPPETGETGGPGSAAERVFGVATSAGQALGRGLLRWETYAMPAVALGVLALTSPYCFIRWTDFLNTFHRMVFTDRQALYDTMIRQIDFADFGFQEGPWVYSLAFCYRYSMGWVAGLVAAGGLGYMLVRRRSIGGLLVLFFAVHFLATASGQAVFMRYYLSLVPVLVVGAGALLSWLAQQVFPGQPRRQAMLMAAAIAVCGFEGLWTSIQQDRLLAREDTRVEARRWLATNLPAGAVVGVPEDYGWGAGHYGYGKPTLPSGSRYKATTPAEIRGEGIRYLLIDDSPLRLYSPPKRPAWEAWLERNARRMLEVSPYRGDPGEIDARYDQLDAFYVPLAGFGGIERPGPRIRVYLIQPQ
jgi:hypothetical protein